MKETIFLFLNPFRITNGQNRNLSPLWALLSLIIFEICFVMLFVYFIPDLIHKGIHDKDISIVFDNMSPSHALIMGGIMVPIIEEYIYRYFITKDSIAYFITPIFIIVLTHIIFILNTKLYSVIFFSNSLFLVLLSIFILLVYLKERKMNITLFKTKYLRLSVYLFSLSFMILHIKNYILKEEFIIVIVPSLLYIFFSSINLYKLRIHFGIRYSIFMHILFNFLIVVVFYND